eukprot:425418-Alexandrium_andersonii.AAC.1
MSASLVGSEMCIRDRHGPRRTQRANWRGRTPPRRGLVRWNIQAALGPVSYTHLTLPTICSV